MIVIQLDIKVYCLNSLFIKFLLHNFIQFFNNIRNELLKDQVRELDSNLSFLLVVVYPFIFILVYLAWN